MSHEIEELFAQLQELYVFNPKTGAGLWLAEAEEGGTDARANAVTVGKDAVYVTGQARLPNGFIEMTTRAYATQ